VGLDRFKVPELLFNPQLVSSYSGVDCPSGDLMGLPGGWRRAAARRAWAPLGRMLVLLGPGGCWRRD
jgi:hypothetical protein